MADMKLATTMAKAATGATVREGRNVSASLAVLHMTDASFVMVRFKHGVPMSIDILSPLEAKITGKVLRGEL
jgi:hypothetical protein